MEKGKTYTINMSEPTGNEDANFTTRPSGSGLADWGTMSIKFDSCTAGSVTLNGIDGVQAFNLVKLTSINGAVCTE